MSNKEIVKNYLIDYLEKEQMVFNKKNVFQCFFCKSEQYSAKISNKRYNCFSCQKNYNIFRLIKELHPDMAQLSDEDIADYLIGYLKITVDAEVEKIFEMYKKNNFALFELSPNTKIPVRESKWRTAGISRDPVQWREWIDNNLGLALRLGLESRVMAVDIDSEATYEQVKHMVNETLTQTTNKGKHLIYQYDPDFYKTINKLARDKGYEIELRVEGAYTVVAPTSVEGEKREWNFRPITTISPELKEFFIKFYDGKQEDKIIDQIQQDIDQETLSVVDLSGKRNDTFVATTGIFSKWMPMKTVEKVMRFLGYNWIDKPIPEHELKAMIDQVRKYRNNDKEELKNQLIHRLDIVEFATAFQLSKTLDFPQKDVEDALKMLVDEEKVLKESNQYRRTRVPNWRTDFMDIEKPLKYPVPIFDDVSYFKDGSMIILGGVTGTGKTTLVANFLKWYKDKGVKPYILSSEKSSGIGDYAAKLGLIEGDFSIYYSKNLQDIEIKDNAVTIIDWLRPTDSQYMKMDTIFENLDIQVNKHGGLLIVLVQLRSSNRSWYAPDLLEFNGFLNAKYLLSEIKDNNGKVTGYDRENTYFHITKMRKPRNKAFPTRIIPMKYDSQTDLISKRGK